MDQTQKKQALNEVNSLKVLKHPFVVKYRESFMHNRYSPTDRRRYLCIIMHFCPKGDLGSLIKKRRVNHDYLSEKQILTWFVQIALGLKHIHENNIIHRDLKSENLFLDAYDNIQIGDFGIGILRCYTARSPAEQVMAETVAGTPYYLAPEICQVFACKPASSLRWQG